MSARLRNTQNKLQSEIFISFNTNNTNLYGERLFWNDALEKLNLNDICNIFRQCMKKF